MQRVAEAADLLQCDIKHMDAKTHECYTGVPNDLILANIRALAQAGKKMVIRHPVVPGFNDSDENVAATAQFMKSLPGVSRIDLLPYNPGGLEKSVRLSGDMDLMQAQTPDDGVVDRIAETFRRYGFDVKIGG